MNSHVKIQKLVQDVGSNSDGLGRRVCLCVCVCIYMHACMYIRMYFFNISLFTTCSITE